MRRWARANAMNAPHCQVGSPLLSAQRTFDWLQEPLSHTPVASTA
jgi:hypothetical protein